MKREVSIQHGLGKGLIRILLVPLVLFCVISIFLFYVSISGVIKRDQNIIGDIIETSIRSNLEAPVLAIQEAMAIHDLIGNPRGYSLYLESFIKNNPLFLSVYVLDPNGIVTNAPLAEQHVIGNDHSGYSYFNPQGESSRINWSSTFISPEDSTITYAFSMVDEHGHSFVGYYSLEELQALINLLSSHSIGKVAVVNSRGFFLAHSDFTKVSQRIQERQVPLGIERQIIRYDGKRTLILQTHLEDINLHILLYQSYFGHYRLLILALLSSVLLMVVLVSLVLTFIKTQSNRISRHLQQLLEGSSCIAEGTYHLSIGHSEFRELNHLADNFNHMSNTIKEAFDDLSRSREEQLALNLSLREQIQRVKENEEQLRLVMENSYDGIVFIDQNSRILRVSQKALDLFQLEEDPQCYVGRDFQQLLHRQPESYSVGMEGMEFEFNTTKILTLNLNGRLIEENIVPVVDSQGQTKGEILCYRDITEKDELQRKLNHALKLEAVGRFAGGIAHDFNNILQVIFGFTELLGQPHSPQEFQDYLENIQDISEKAETLVRQLLAFCRMEDKTSQLVTLDSVVMNISSILERLVGDNITLQMELDDRGFLVDLVPAQIEQVLVNLVVNGRDAMKKGAITVRSRHRILESRGWVILEVEDQGTGIPQEIQDKIFDPFFSTKDVGKGSGLGLATVFGIVEGHGAKLELESTLGSGSLFRILFPAKSSGNQDSAR